MKLIKIDNSTYINEDDICRIKIEINSNEYWKWEYESVKIEDNTSLLGYTRIGRYRHKETNEIVTEKERKMRSSRFIILLKTKYQGEDILYKLSYKDFIKLGIELLIDSEEINETKKEIE